MRSPEQTDKVVHGKEEGPIKTCKRTRDIINEP